MLDQINRDEGIPLLQDAGLKAEEAFQWLEDAQTRVFGNSELAKEAHDCGRLCQTARACLEKMPLKSERNLKQEQAVHCWFGKWLVYVGVSLVPGGKHFLKNQNGLLVLSPGLRHLQNLRPNSVLESFLLSRKFWQSKTNCYVTRMDWNCIRAYFFHNGFLNLSWDRG